MKSSPAARSWMAAGVRYELLMRALPAIRHEVVAPASVLRMAMLVLAHDLKADPVDPQVCVRRAAVIDEQIGAIVDAMRALRGWELGAHEAPLTRSALVMQGVQLMRMAFNLHGIALEVDETLHPREEEPRFAQGAALRYLFLGALAYLHDSTPTPYGIRIEAEHEDRLRLVGLEGERPPAHPLHTAERAPCELAIDTIAMQSLADDLGLDIRMESDAVHLHLGTSAPPSPIMDR